MKRRRNTRRWWRSRKAVFIAALGVSLFFHFRVYDELGWISKQNKNKQAKESLGASEVEFNVEAPEEVKPERRALDVKPKETLPEKLAENKPVVKVPELTPKELPKVVEQKKPETPKTNQQAVKQKSRDPNVKTPDNAKYLAKENQRVEEETVAKVRSYYHNDDEQQDTGKEQNKEPGAEDKGKRPDEVQKEISKTIALNKQDTEQAARAEKGQKQRTQAQGAQSNSSARSGQEAAQDKWLEGELAVRRAQSDKQARTGQRLFEEILRNRGAGKASKGSATKLGWATFEKTYGVDQLSKERNAYDEAQLKKRMQRWGGGSGKRWKEFRAAIENFVPNVKPGNQTALNAAASPYADYLTEVHLKIHEYYVDVFLAGLPIGPDPMNDATLVSKLEIIINADGSLYKVGVVESSGLLAFDYGAYSSVVTAQPFPRPPSNILSADGRVYFRWGFYRNERQCGTFNAEPYILNNAPSKKSQPSDPLSVLLPRGVVESSSTSHT